MYRGLPRQLLIGATLAFVMGLAPLATTSSTAELGGGLLTNFRDAAGISGTDSQADANADERCTSATQGIANAGEHAALEVSGAATAGGVNATVECETGGGSNDEQNQDAADDSQGTKDDGDDDAGDDIDNGVDDDADDEGSGQTSIARTAANNPDGHCVMLPSVSNVVSAPGQHPDWDILGGDCPSDGVTTTTESLPPQSELEDED